MCQGMKSDYKWEHTVCPNPRPWVQTIIEWITRWNRFVPRYTCTVVGGVFGELWRHGAPLLGHMLFKQPKTSNSVPSQQGKNLELDFICVGQHYTDFRIGNIRTSIGSSEAGFQIICSLNDLWKQSILYFRFDYIYFFLLWRYNENSVNHIIRVVRYNAISIIHVHVLSHTRTSRTDLRWRNCWSSLPVVLFRKLA